MMESDRIFLSACKRMSRGSGGEEGIQTYMRRGSNCRIDAFSAGYLARLYLSSASNLVNHAFIELAASQRASSVLAHIVPNCCWCGDWRSIRRIQYIR